MEKNIIFEGIGWVMVILSIIACFKSTRQNKACFVFYGITSSWWCFYNLFIIDCQQQGLLRLFYFFMTMYGYYNWSNLEKERENKNG